MKVEKRTEPLRLVRNAKKVPGVIFGKGIVPLSIQVDENELLDTIRNYGYSQTFKIKIGSVSHTVYIKEVQRDVVNHNHYLNVKLLKVGKGDTIVANIPINFIGKEEIEKPSVALHIITDNVEVEYEVGKGVSHIDVDISKMEVGQTLYIKDLKMPEGLKVHDDANNTLVSLSDVYLPDPEEETEEEVKEPDQDPSKVEAIKQKADQ